MTDTWIVILQLALTLIGVISAAVPTFYRMKVQREREEAAGKKDLAGSAMEMVDRWEARCNALDARAKELEDRLAEKETEWDARLHRVELEVRYWQRGATMLIQQLVKAGLKPCFDPNGGPTPEDLEEISASQRIDL